MSDSSHPPPLGHPPPPGHPPSPGTASRTAAGPAVCSPAPALGIIAGGGGLPLEVAAAATRGGRAVHIVALDGFAGPGVARFPHSRASLGQVGAILASLRSAGCRDLVIAGSLERPDLLRLRFDLGALTRWRVLLGLTRGGDDSILRRVVRFFEGEGFRVVGVAEVAPHLVAPEGAFGASLPAVTHAAAISRAARLIRALGPFDVGQAAVATADGIVAVEGVRGTDAMLRDLGAGGIGEHRGMGGVLVKLAKPGQEMRVDLPAIGPGTIGGASAAGLAGIAVGAGAAIVLERQAMAEAADRAGLFVAGIVPQDDPGPPLPPPSDALLAVLARRAPTPADRRDIAVGRRLLPVLRANGAGRAAVIERGHVRAIAGALPVAGVVAALGRGASWGARAFKRQIGILMLDVAGEQAGVCAEAALPGLEEFRAAVAAGLAGVVCLGAPLPAARLKDMEAWANEARVFLMGEIGPPSDTAQRKF